MQSMRSERQEEGPEHQRVHDWNGTTTWFPVDFPEANPMMMFMKMFMVPCSCGSIVWIYLD